jgi:hypothetical protein
VKEKIVMIVMLYCMYKLGKKKRCGPEGPTARSVGCDRIQWGGGISW